MGKLKKAPLDDWRTALLCIVGDIVNDGGWKY
jgi:hypothetical protein